MIILQFLLQTFFVAIAAMFFLPVVHQIAFDSGTFDNASATVQGFVAQAWIWSIVFFIAGAGGNCVWFLQALQRKQREEVTF